MGASLMARRLPALCTLPALLAAVAAAPLISVGAAPPLQAAETKTFTYDALGRIVKVKNTGTVNNNQIRSFCYDAAGNRTEFDSNSSGTPAACVTTG
jgi:YD repeat-containing protein